MIEARPPARKPKLPRRLGSRRSCGQVCTRIPHQPHARLATSPVTTTCLQLRTAALGELALDRLASTSHGAALGHKDRRVLPHRWELRRRHGVLDVRHGADLAEVKPTGAGDTIKKSDLKELVEAAKKAWAEEETDEDSSEDSEDMKDLD